jgi:hypothetical protein
MEIRVLRFFCDLTSDFFPDIRLKFSFTVVVVLFGSRGREREDNFEIRMLKDVHFCATGAGIARLAPLPLT